MPKEIRVVARNLGFPEDLRWHADALWFSDMDQKAVMKLDSRGHLETVVEVEGTPSGLGWLPDRSLIVVSMSDRRLLKVDGKDLRQVADLSGLASFRCNDMVVDDKGRAYVGTFGFDLEGLAAFSPGEVILARQEGPPRVVASGMAFPNGLAITPDRTTLIVAETLGERLVGFDIQADGSLENGRTWAAMPGTAPDGISLDAEGYVWVASPVNRAVFRVREGGEISDEVKVETQPYACRLGGTNGKTLFIATSYDLPSLFAAKGLPMPRGVEERRASGRIESVEVDVPGDGFP